MWCAGADTSFGGVYPAGNNVTITGGWTFEDMQGRPYAASAGAAYHGAAVPGKMLWTRELPYLVLGGEQQVNVHFVAEGGPNATNNAT